jgi:hypothetical protein
MSETYTKQSIDYYNYAYASIGYSIQPDGSVSGSKKATTTRGSQMTKTNTFAGEKNPLWRAQVRSGTNATTSASGQKHTFFSIPFGASTSFVVWDANFPVDTRITHFYSRYGTIPYASGSTIVSANASTTTSVRNRVISKFINKCKDARSSIEGGQNLYEIKQTLNSIRHPFKSLSQLTSHYLHTMAKIKPSRKYRGPKGVKGLTKAMSDTYLEYNFGVAPVAADIAQLIADAGRARFDTVPVSARASQEFGGLSESFDPPNPPFMEYSMTKTTKSRLTIRYKGAVRTGVGDDQLVSTAQGFRLLPEDFFPTVYAVLPFSWMFDYVANVNEIIEALSFARSNVSWDCVTSRTENVVTYEGNGNPKITGLSSSGSNRFKVDAINAYGGNARFTSVSFSRSRLTATDFLPDFEIKIPTKVKPFINSFMVLLQHASKA